MLRILLLALALVELPGNAETGRAFVYVKELSEVTKWLMVSCNDEAAAEVRQGSFFVLELEPGSYLLTIGKGVPTAIDVRAGRDSFVRVDLSFGAAREAIPTLTRVTPALAEKELRHLFYIDKKRIRSVRVMREDPRSAIGPRLRGGGER